MSEQSLSSTDGRELRSDARRNLARILDAADEVFAAEGPAATTAEVARRAGVASGTVFRHFPTKAALVTAVFVRRLESLAVAAEEAGSSDRPGAAFSDLFARWAREFADKQVFVDALSAAGIDPAGAAGHAGYRAVRHRLDAALGALLHAAQAAGDIRRDVTVEDIHTLLAVPARSGPNRPPDTVLAVILAGLQA